MLTVGTKIQAKLIEAVSENHWIVSFQGQLIQVKNTSEIKFKEGRMLNLVVEKSRPLQLKILTAERSQRSINLRV